MDIKQLVNITSKAWCMAILSGLHQRVPGRQAPLLAATGASRTAFAQSLEHLIRVGLVERNPGHGHPLRPEFRLTDAGVVAARLAYQVYSRTPVDQRDLLRRTWTLPILVTLKTPRHFNEIGRGLHRITDRALSQSLQNMEARDWIERQVHTASRPPRPLYRAINTGAVVSQIVGQETDIG